MCQFSGLPLDWTPRIPTRVVPKAVTTSRRRGVATSSTALPSRSTVKTSSRVARGLHDALHVLEAIDLGPVDRNDQIARLKSGRLGGAAGGDAVHGGQKDGAPIHVKNAGENDDRQKEIGNRASGDDRRPLPDRLGKETDRPFLWRHGRGGRCIRHRGTVGVAMEFDITAERQGGQPPMRSVAIVEAKNFRSETERECIDLNTAPAADQKMSELVKENHEAQDKKERHYVSRERPNMGEDGHWNS